MNGNEHLPDKTSREVLVAALARAGAEVKRNAFRCPWHDDRNPSAGLIQGRDGSWRFKCHGCGAAGDVWDVEARIAGMDVRDWLKSQRPAAIAPRAAAVRQPPAKPSEPEEERDLEPFPSIEDAAEAVAARLCGRLADIHRYSGAFAVIRIEFPSVEGAKPTKTFRQASCKDGVWTLTGGPKPWPLYRLEDVMASKIVIITEGEKKADALAKLKFCVTSTPGGAEKAQYCDLRPLAGKIVYIWPDNDEKGMKHGRDLLARLSRLSDCRPYLIDPETLPVPMPPKGDAIEFIALAGDKAAEMLFRVMSELPEKTGPAHELRQHIDRQVRGEFSRLPMPWPLVERVSHCLLPGTVTIFCGAPGVAKTIAGMQLAYYLHRLGHRVAVRMLEDSREFHLQRLLAQLSGNTQLTDPEYIKQFPNVADVEYRRFRDELDAFGLRLCVQGGTVEEIAEWVRDRSSNGARFVLVDSVTLADPGQCRAWEADGLFMRKAKATIEEFGVSLWLTTHPRKSGGVAKATGGNPQISSLDEVAGGAIYQRAAQTVLWLRHHAGTQPVNCRGFDGEDRQELPHKDMLVLKSRNGPGSGRAFGMKLGAGLVLSELGELVEEGSTRRDTGRAPEATPEARPWYNDTEGA